MSLCSELPDIFTGSDPSDMFCQIGRVMTIIGTYFSPQHWSLLLMEDKTGRLTFEVVMGVDADTLKGVHLEKGEGIVGWVCRHATPVVAEDASQDPRFSPRIDHLIGFTTRSVVCVPLLNGQNKVVGAIEPINKIVPPSVRSASGASAQEIIPTPNTFTETDMKILSSIGIFTGVAIENAFLYQQIKELATIDSLTGLYNRSSFNDMLKQETDRVKRYRHTIYMLMLDVDDFKTINDTYGGAAMTTSLNEQQ